MTRRRTHILALSLLTGGITGGTFGMLTGHMTIGWVGLGLTAAAMPLMICRSIQLTAYVNEQRLTDAHNAGYVLALEHVALGLLDPEAAPPEGPGTNTPPNVYFLRSQSQAGDDDWKPERKAQ